VKLWHVSEDADIPRFEPRANAEHDSLEPLVWAIDDEHVPAYWFPRDCPRGTFWAVERTSDEDVERFLTGDRHRRVHAIQSDWLDRFRAGRVFAYELPVESFERYGRAAGYWVSRGTVQPLEVVELTDLLARHAEAGIELRIVPDLRASGTASSPRLSSSAASACATCDRAPRASPLRVPDRRT
jgi:hypothetical protein